MLCAYAEREMGLPALESVSPAPSTGRFAIQATGPTKNPTSFATPGF
jgi:hypothetical protein